MCVLHFCHCVPRKSAKSLSLSSGTIDSWSEQWHCTDTSGSGSCCLHPYSKRTWHYVVFRLDFTFSSSEAEDFEVTSKTSPDFIMTWLVVDHNGRIHLPCISNRSSKGSSLRDYRWQGCIFSGKLFSDGLGEPASGKKGHCSITSPRTSLQIAKQGFVTLFKRARVSFLKIQWPRWQSTHAQVCMMHRWGWCFQVVLIKKGAFSHGKTSVLVPTRSCLAATGHFFLGRQILPRGVLSQVDISLSSS